MNLTAATIALFLALTATPVAADATASHMHVHVRVHAEAAASGGNATLDTTSVAFPEPVDGGLAIGEWVSLNPENYTIVDTCKPQEWTVKQTKAASLQLHFAVIALAGHKIVVSAPNGSFAQEFSSESALHDVTTTTIPGSSAKIAYQPSSAAGGSCDSSQPRPSFELDRVSVLWSQVKKEAICGKDTSKTVKCFSGEMYKKSKAVLLSSRRLADNKISVCSAWIFTKDGYIVTNNHCVHDSKTLSETTFMFQNEVACGADCNFQTCTVAYVLFGFLGEVRLLKTNSVLDYTVIQISNKKKAAEVVQKFGYLKLQRAPVKVGDQIYIPQLPGGKAKRIAASDNDAGSNYATITGTNVKMTISGKPSVGLLRYAADTDHGSSGSPVLSRTTNAVVGLHRGGDGCANVATPAETLLDEFEMYLTGVDGIQG